MHIPPLVLTVRKGFLERMHSSSPDEDTLDRYGSSFPEESPPSDTEDNEGSDDDDEISPGSGSSCIMIQATSSH